MGDSGGAVFLQDGGVWKLAGINYAVDGPFYTDATGNGSFFGALFDARDFYVSDGGNPPTYTLITGANAVPTGFYSTRVSSKLDWLYSVIDPAGDFDGNGISNLLQYARSLNSVTVEPGWQTNVSKEAGFLTLTYRKITDAQGLQYQVEKSIDLISWSAAASQDEVVSTQGNIQTIKAKVPIGSAARLFLRLKITGP